MQYLGIHEEYFYETATVPAVVAATMFGSQCGSLLSLSIMVPTVGLEGDGITALAALTRLTYLDVRDPRSRSVYPSRCATIIDRGVVLALLGVEHGRCSDCATCMQDGSSGVANLESMG